MNYNELNNLLQGRCRLRKKLANNTYAIRLDPPPALSVRLHQTDILTFTPDGKCVINVGRWKTPVTRDRLNAYLPHPWGIRKESGIWYWHSMVSYGNEKIFCNGDSIKDEKLSMNADTCVKELVHQRVLLKHIGKYAKAFEAALPVRFPGAGDCFFCYMRSKTSNLPLGEAFKDTSHLDSHMEENYFVPSLLARALEFCRAGPVWGWRAFKQPNEEKQFPKLGGHGQYARFLRRYLRRQYGLA